MKQLLYSSLVALSLVFLACAGESDPAMGEQAAEEAESTEAAEEPERLSPHETVTGKIGEANITVTYGRPYKKGREIYGGLVPYDEVWRTGADEATTFATDRDLMVGALHVPAGEYSLFTIPAMEKWTLVLNNVAEQWGAFRYDEAQDLGRVEMSVSETDAMLEQLTIRIEPGEGMNGTLNVDWDMTSASVPIMSH